MNQSKYVQTRLQVNNPSNKTVILTSVTTQLKQVHASNTGANVLVPGTRVHPPSAAITTVTSAPSIFKIENERLSHPLGGRA